MDGALTTLSRACASLLARARAFGPLYGDRLANHLPMALIALDRLGADKAALDLFFDHYSRRLEPLADAPGIADPRASLGEGRDYAAVARYFEQVIARMGRQAVLREWLPLLMPGVSASAFHALIRLAYAIDAGDDTETALALAYWAVEFTPLPISMEVAELDLAQIAGQLAHAVEGFRFSPGNIGQRMREIARHPALAETRIQPQVHTLHGLANFALSAFFDHDDFTLLHIMTGCHAFRIVWPYVDKQQLALRYMWQAALMAYLTVPRTKECAAGHAGGINMQEEELQSVCRSSLDDHLIKLCYSALCEYREYQDERYRAVIGRKINRRE